MSSPTQKLAPVPAARRRLAVVLVEGLDPTGIRIAEQLIRLGIGTVLLRDDRPMVGPSCRSADQGRPRAEVFSRRLRPSDHRSAVLEAPEGSRVLGLDLHLLVICGETDVTRLRSAFYNDSTVLPVERSRTGFCIGPLLGQRAAVCPECLVLYGLTVGSQAPENLRTGPIDDALEPVVAEVAVQQARLLIDGEPAAVGTGALFGESGTGLLGHRPVGAHPECRCLTDINDQTDSASRPAPRSRRRIRHGDPIEAVS